MDTPHSVGLLGGSFDPIHFGHLITARYVGEELSLDRIVFIPSACPPHKQDHSLIDAVHRAQMVRLAIADEEGLDISECELARTGPSYTIETVSEFRKELGAQARICWIVGADSLAELHTWHRVGALIDTCEIITAARPGWQTPEPADLQEHLSAGQVQRLRKGIIKTPRIDISSTDIRSRVSAGRSIRYLVPEAVQDYIRRQGFYRVRA